MNQASGNHATRKNGPPRRIVSAAVSCGVGQILRIAGFLGLVVTIVLAVINAQAIVQGATVGLNMSVVALVALALASLLVAGAGQALIYLSRIAHSSAMTLHHLRAD